VIVISIFFEIHKGLPREGPGDNASTRKAYSLLKDLPPEPLILDIGCGPGMQTIELAKISQGKIVAIDTHQPFLDELDKRAKKEGLKSKIKTINKSMFAMDFNNNEFDIIWSEGAAYIYGFEKALKDWKKYLKISGYFVVTEASWIKNNPPNEIKEFWEDAYPDIKTINENKDIIQKAQYNLITHFILPEKSWWENYYIPMENRLKELRRKYRGNNDIEEQLDEEFKEIEMYKKYSDYYGYVFYIMKLSE
jgi:ubiquinone/menaquinone biosynthesis C-methylase UbiE